MESLSPTEVRFLQVLMAALDRTVPTETLLNRVWFDSDLPDPSYVWVTVRRLRNKIERDPSQPRVLLTAASATGSAPSAACGPEDLGMDLERPTLRVFLLVAAVVVPALVALALVVVFAASWVEEVGVGTALLVVGLGSLLWGAVVALIGSRTLSRDLHGVVSMAERGGVQSGLVAAADDQGDLSAAQRRLKSALDERNRQIAVLAAEMAAAPITGGPAGVAARAVAVTRDATRDPTWSLVVLRTSDPALLPVGVYDGDTATAPRPPGELEQWAAVAEPPDAPGPRQLDGPWGAVVTVDASSGEALTALLLAPWEDDRANPGRARSAQPRGPDRGRGDRAGAALRSAPRADR